MVNGIVGWSIQCDVVDVPEKPIDVKKSTQEMEIDEYQKREPLTAMGYSIDIVPVVTLFIISMMSAT